MSTAFDFDLSEIEDIADISLDDASTYQDQTGPAPLAPGNFRFRVVEAGRRVDQDGNPIDDNGYPQFQISKLEIVEPEEFKGREIYPFKSYSLRPIQSGQRKGSIPAVDFLRGFDDSLTFANGKELLQLIAEQIANAKTFVAATNWLAKDSEFIRETIDEYGSGSLDDMSEEERKTLFKRSIFRGQKKFPKKNGVFVPEVVGPSGNTLEAKVDLTRVYPSSKEVKKMGPFKKQR